MSVYFQHVGEGGGKRDFPRTIGTQAKGLKRFHFAEVEGHLSHLTQSERDQLAADCDHHAQDGFQIWGLPTGAKHVLRKLENGDILLLLESATFRGAFHYGGRVIAHPSDQCFDLSKWLWGEQKFALIVFLKGHLTSYSWYEFCDAVGYKNNWNPAGKTYRVPPERLLASPFISELGLVRAVIGNNI